MNYRNDIMDRGYQRFRGTQQTIPGMIQKRGHGMQNFTSSMSPMTSGVGTPGVYCQQPSALGTPRMTPYKVPFQRRQLAEPLYADSAPVIIPQPIQLSSPYGLGTLYGGTSGLYMPNYQQNVNKSLHMDNSSNMYFQEEIGMRSDQEGLITGLTSSPPNHPLLQEVVPNFCNVQKTIEKPKENIPCPISESLESKSSIPNESEMRKVAQMNSSASKPPFDQSKISPRVLTGSIDKVMKWERIWENKLEKPNILYEIIAPLLQMKAGSKVLEKQILIREPGGPVLTVLYYEIDQMVPQLTIGGYVRCVCRSLGKRRYQAFTVRPATPKERSSLERLSFVSHRAVQESFLSTPEP